MAPTKERPTRRKQRRSQASHFAWKLRRAGLPVPELPKGDETKVRQSRQSKRRHNKRMRRAAAAAAAATTTATTTTNTAAPATLPTTENKSRVMAGSSQSKKDGNKPLDFEQPLTFRPKKGTTVVESHSHDLTLALRPKKGPA